MSSWWFFFTSYQLSLCNNYLLDISKRIFFMVFKEATGMKTCNIWPRFFIPTDWLLVWLWLSIVSHSCELQIIRLYLDIWNENTLLPFHLVVMHLCLYSSTKLSESRSGCNECSKQVGMWAKSVRAFIFLVPSMPLPHSREALQLLQGSTVWSFPVCLQSKQQWDNLRATHRAACHTNSSHKGVRT